MLCLYSSGNSATDSIESYNAISNRCITKMMIVENKYLINIDKIIEVYHSLIVLSMGSSEDQLK